MKKFPKPWYRPSRGLWYVTLDGRQINLGPDKDAAFEEYKRLLAQPAGRVVSMDSVHALMDAYLDWCQKHRAPETFRWYLDCLQAFAKTIPDDLPVGRLRPFHVQKWVDTHEDWSSGSRRNAIAAVKRVFAWAEEQGYIDRSPVAHLRKPRCGKKEVIVPEEHYQEMLTCRDQEFRDLLTVTWETGCRPQESLRVEARHVDVSNQRWVIPTTPGKPDNRVVYLTDESMEITKRLMLKYPEGPIFRNRYGRPWTTDAVNCHFHRFVEKLGKRYSLYAIRHTWITRMLQKGVHDRRQDWLQRSRSRASENQRAAEGTGCRTPPYDHVRQRHRIRALRPLGKAPGNGVILCRSRLSVSAWYEREHQWLDSTVFSQGNRFSRRLPSRGAPRGTTTCGRQAEMRMIHKL